MAVLNREHAFNMDMSYREEVLSKISSMIESKAGRSKPTVCEYSRYEKNKEVIEKEIKRKKHFSEGDWPDCVKIIVDSIRCLKETELDNVSSDEEISFNDARASKKPMFNRNTTIRPDQLVQRPKLLTPRELQEQSNTKLQETYVVEKYKAQVEIAIKELEKSFKEYEKSPEKHPMYSDEWKAFWSRKYKELLAQGKDANSHDYKPEWIEFWTERMKELHKIDIDKKKETFRKKLGLSIDAISKIESAPVQPRADRRRSRTRSPKLLRQRRMSKSPPNRIVEISDSDEDHPRRSSEPKNKRYRSEYSRNSEERSRSRFSEDSPYSRHSDYRSKDGYDSKYYANRGRERDYDRSGHVKSKSPEIIDDGPVNLISVCRLLSALESELGLLAPSILELLAKAVALEKMNPNSADELLFITENNNILETVKEKLKGVLTANLISSNKIFAVKRAVQNIATLLHEISKRKPSKSKIEVPKVSTQTNENALNDSLDPVAVAKMQIAIAITENLMKEGRSNVSPEELEILVEGFMNSANDDDEEIHEEMEVVQEPIKVEENVKIEPKKQEGSSVTGLENLTDEDLQTLLRNFADLTSDEQSHLIAYLSKIEQTNPTRVEKLRKYVNIGDGDGELDDIKEEDMDLASGVIDLSPKLIRAKSPVPRQELSDDDEEFNDEQMARHLGRSHQTDRQQAGPSNGFTNGSSNGAGPSNTLKDNDRLADSLMSSLMQSSLPAPSANPWTMQSSGMTGAFYQQPQMPQYQEMVGNMSLYEQQLAMNMSMQRPVSQAENLWPSNAASNFFQEVQIPPEYNNSNKNNRDKGSFRKRYDNPNRQLTGKGKQRK